MKRLLPVPPTGAGTRQDRDGLRQKRAVTVTRSEKMIGESALIVVLMTCIVGSGRESGHRQRPQRGRPTLAPDGSGQRGDKEKP
jgi:hypothetical protein